MFKQISEFIKSGLISKKDEEVKLKEEVKKWQKEKFKKKK